MFTMMPCLVSAETLSLKGILLGDEDYNLPFNSTALLSTNPFGLNSTDISAILVLKRVPSRRIVNVALL